MSRKGLFRKTAYPPQNNMSSRPDHSGPKPRGSDMIYIILYEVRINIYMNIGGKCSCSWLPANSKSSLQDFSQY